MLTIVSLFNFLKKEAKDSEEYKQLKELILSIGKKHQSLDEWCNNFVEKPLPVYEDYINENYSINIDLQVAFNLNQLKK